MIYLENGQFYALASEPFAKELMKLDWRFDGKRYYTDDVQKLVPVIEYLTPELMEDMLGQKSGYAQSTALKPSEGFTVPLPDGVSLYDFQLASVEYILDRDNTLLAQEPGLGKSAIMTAVANATEPKRVLIICPAVAKYNWALKEWPKFSTLTLSVGVAESKHWPETDVVIINYDILHTWKKNIQAVNWDLLIVDESHRVKNEEARRSVMVYGGYLRQKQADAALSGGQKTDKRGKYYYQPIPFGKRILATATPMNRPIDLWTTVKACDPTGLGRNRKAFEDRYCAAMNTVFGRNVRGADNLGELGLAMRDRFMVRHNPDEVLDLPPMREELFLLPPVKIVLDEENDFIRQNIEALSALAKSMNKTKKAAEPIEEFYLRTLGEAIIDNVSLIGKPEFAVLFTRFAEIRKKTALAKVPHVVDFVRDLTDDGERPIVIFGYHRDFMEALSHEFEGAAMIVGGMSAKKKDDEKNRFQNGETPWFLGNIDAAGEAITLTRADVMVFGEMDWRGTALTQARKRIHRIGQDRPCTAYYLAAAKSFDSFVADSAFTKIQNIKDTLDSGI